MSGAEDCVGISWWYMNGAHLLMGQVGGLPLSHLALQATQVLRQLQYLQVNVDRHGRSCYISSCWPYCCGVITVRDGPGLYFFLAGVHRVLHYARHLQGAVPNSLAVSADDGGHMTSAGLLQL